MVMSDKTGIATSNDSLLPQHTSAYVSIRQHTSAYVSIRQHTSAYVSIRQHTYGDERQDGHRDIQRQSVATAYVSIRQHTSAYVW
jgi:hypothetical protein